MSYKEGDVRGFNRGRLEASLAMVAGAKDELKSLPLPPETIEQILSAAWRIAEGVRDASEVIHHPAVTKKDLDLLLNGAARGNVGTNTEFEFAKEQYWSLPETIYQ